MGSIHKDYSQVPLGHKIPELLESLHLPGCKGRRHAFLVGVAFAGSLIWKFIHPSSVFPGRVCPLNCRPHEPGACTAHVRVASAEVAGRALCQQEEMVFLKAALSRCWFEERMRQSFRSTFSGLGWLLGVRAQRPPYPGPHPGVLEG